MNYTNIDKVISEYYSFLPFGSNFYDTTHDFNFDFKENETILKFLVDNEILDIWGERYKFIITEKGIDILKNHGGIENYLQYEKQEKVKEIYLKKLQNEKLVLDTKLARWQVKSFWYVFIFGLLGGIYSVYSVIDTIVGESQEQKIERILENKLKEKEQLDTIYQRNMDTISKAKPDKKPLPTSDSFD